MCGGAWDDEQQRAAVIVPKSPRAGPARRRGTRRALAVLLALQAAAPIAVHAGPQSGSARLPMSDHSPFTGILGLPDGWTGAASPDAEIAWIVANDAVGQQTASESLLFDGETHVLELRAQRRIGERLRLGVEVPWISHGGGFLDRAIDNWHDAFGLDQGIRPSLPTGELSYLYARDGAQTVALQNYAAGLGDVTTSAAWTLAGAGAGPDALRVELTGDVQWATGDTDKLTGNGATDVAAGLSLTAPATGDGRFGWSARAGILWPGEADPALPTTAGQVYYYEGSLSWRLVPSLDLALQALGHSGAWQSGLKLLGSRSLQLGGGGTWRFGRRYGLRAAVFEDLRTDTASDFTMEIALLYLP
jgi:hypothetical protein